eukprot:CAMPEP_0113822836 /NCGR_PEP_ID=MMETSP0328-20130328/2442_1 /TAXON_ID=39455 /ORGANISM="Alexandrium minutum" /LENGTH=159 /DNA_ID=CAMNT_0000790777 /DNA_START=94 /DNA_END=573 /DNA_ORIENTATION=- /assembly_acc=CAM_ASM_000350
MSSMHFLVVFLSVLPFASADGACDNANDMKIWEDSAKAQISKIQMDCILHGAPGARWNETCLRAFMAEDEPGKDKNMGKACVSNCVSKKVNLTKACSDCFGDLAECSYKNCAMRCLRPDTPDCKKCGADHCTPAMVKCSGIKDLPGMSTNMTAYAQLLV